MSLDGDIPVTIAQRADAVLSEARAHVERPNAPLASAVFGTVRRRVDDPEARARRVWLAEHLNALGLSNGRIGLMLGVTKQRVEQLLKLGKRHRASEQRKARQSGREREAKTRCMCLCLKREHQNGDGKCSCDRCPEFFELGT